MSTEKSDRGTRVSRIIVRFHASALLIIAPLALIVASLGWNGLGPYGILAKQPLGYIGLYQAYLLMVLIALTAWIGSLRWDSRLWNALLMVAEMVPATIVLIATPVFIATGEQDMAHLALMIHLPMMTLEGVALLWNIPQLTRFYHPSAVRQR
jgi:hypothetical protein